MKRFTNHPEPWGDFVDVKMWPEIKNARRFAGKEAFLGSVTDCYGKCSLKGHLFCGGVGGPNEIAGNARLQEAYTMGKNI